jgi:pentatricopeptide repeat protein
VVFDLMCRVYKIEWKVEHYGCMVDLLARAGLMKDSKEVISKMPMESGPALWGSELYFLLVGDTQIQSLCVVIKYICYRREMG